MNILDRHEKFFLEENKFFQDAKTIFDLKKDNNYINSETFLLQNKEQIVHFLNENKKYILNFNSQFKWLVEIKTVKDFIKYIFIYNYGWFLYYGSKVNDWIVWLHMFDEHIWIDKKREHKRLHDFDSNLFSSWFDLKNKTSLEFLYTLLNSNLENEVKVEFENKIYSIFSKNKRLNIL